MIISKMLLWWKKGARGWLEANRHVFCLYTALRLHVAIVKDYMGPQNTKYTHLPTIPSHL